MAPELAPLPPTLLEQLKALPAKPGVYIFRDAAGAVIYVGKAVSLRNRVRQYFGSARGFEPKLRALREKIADLEFIVTSTEQEALLLEATLVKRYQPFFNVRLKDDKHYPYLKIDLNDPWPRVYITRRVEKDGARYFGPYANAGSVRRTLELVNKLFPWRSCTKVITGKDPRPCLDYYIHRCIAPCAGYCSKEEYDAVIRQVILFLEGRDDEVVRDLKAQMEAAAEDLEFERAARLRDQIQAIERVRENQIMAMTKPADMDVFGLARNDDEGGVQVFFVRGTNVVGRDHFRLEGVRDEADEAILSAFVRQFYEAATYIPKEIVLPKPIDDAAPIEAWLSERRGGRVRLVTPSKGEKRQLAALAQENARETLEMNRVKWLADSRKTMAALEELQAELDLPALPRRIECYDISNIQGTAIVGSMVVFVDGRPRNSEYRRFQIKSVSGAPNDFASMAEMLRRRFKRLAERRSHGEEMEDESFGAVPDLVIIDGGKGQLGYALDVMRDLGLKDIPMCGLAKQNEEIYVQDISEPIVLPRQSQALYLVQRIRDEAHRFAITYHRNLRLKQGMQSALDAVPGIGPKRKKALLQKFGSVQRIREASPEEIAATVGFTLKLAHQVKAHL
jgi:excinuclease ABC subunit C